MYSDSSTSSSQNSRRVGFKNNVAVYRFDSDGEDSAGYSSAVSETSEQLGAHSRRQKLQHRQNHSQSHGIAPSPHDHRPLPPTTHDAAASWEAARGWSTTADRVGSPRHSADGHHDRQQLVADSLPSPTRLRSDSVGSGRSQLATISRTLYVDDEDDERRRNGSVGGRTSKYDHPARENTTHSQRKTPVASDEGCVLSCGSVAVHNPLFIDRAHYEYIQVGHLTVTA